MDLWGLISALSSTGIRGAGHVRWGANAWNGQNYSSAEVSNCKKVRGHIRPKTDPAAQAKLENMGLVLSLSGQVCVTMQVGT